MANVHNLDERIPTSTFSQKELRNVERQIDAEEAKVLRQTCAYVPENMVTKPMLKSHGI